MVTKNNQNVLAIGLALTTVFEPIINAAAADIKRGDAKQDTGQDRAPDGGLKFMLARSAQLWHDQIYGNIPTSNGRKFYNVKEQFDYAQTEMNKLFREYKEDSEGFLADPRCHFAANRLELAEARYNAYAEMLHGFMDAYKKCTGETWKAYVRPVDEKARAANVEAAVTSARMQSLAAKLASRTKELNAGAQLLRKNEAGELQTVAAQ